MVGGVTLEHCTVVPVDSEARQSRGPMDVVVDGVDTLGLRRSGIRDTRRRDRLNGVGCVDIDERSARVRIATNGIMSTEGELGD